MNDLVNITTEGGLYLPRMDKNDNAHWKYDMNVVHSRDRVLDLLDGGQHTDDHTKQERRKCRREYDLPCKVMLRDFAENAYKRPEISTMRLINNK